MSNENYYFPINNIGDMVVNLDTTTVNDTVENVMLNSEGDMWLQAGSDKLPNLCYNGPGTVTGVFKDVNTHENYTIVSKSLLGPHPPTHPPR